MMRPGTGQNLNSTPNNAHGKRVALVTGGAGFIGSNLTQRLLAEGVKVRVLDNGSRSGVMHNLAWLQNVGPANQLELIEGDVRDISTLRSAVRDVTEIYHLAAQVAVTTSVDDPETDFHVNATGTVNLLEAVRSLPAKPSLLYTSTNKVYGSLHGVPVQRAGSRYEAVAPDFQGVQESEPLDFHSPYGCSKGAADQYVRDYARIYGMPTVVFRMSCIAGPRQFGNEDQGWVAHFLYSTLAGKPITIYGDGLQVRDVLHVHDLVDAMLLARANMQTTRGEVYNVGGGMGRTVSVQEMLGAIEQLTGIAPRLNYATARPGDQPLYISDTAKLESATGWAAKRSISDILAAIQDFWMENRDLMRTRFRVEQPSEALAVGVA
ncbi:MAG: SDR family NAD(P)-dependent oxidoreductase [Janthinobacterium lividum]